MKIAKNIITYLFTATLILTCAYDITAEHFENDKCNHTNNQEASIIHYSIVAELVDSTITELFLTLCENETIIVNGTIYDINNPIGIETIVGSSGCDSIIHIELEFVQTITFEINDLVCDGDSVIINGNIYNENNPFGTEVLIGSTGNGCDSIIQVNLNFLDSGFATNGPNMAANFLYADSYQWFLEGSPIEGATSNSWTAIEDGNYSMQITIDGVICISESQYVAVTSLLDISKDLSISIYPNPAKDFISIKMDKEMEDKIMRYEIINIDGRLVQKGNYNSHINIESIASGVFTIRLFDRDQNIYSEQIVVR